MTDTIRAALDAANRASPFNRFFDFRLIETASGSATLAMTARDEARNHAGTPHAGMTAGLLDTAAGYAAATVAGNVVTVGLTVNYVAASKGTEFVAHATVVRAGSRQVFVDARLIEPATDATPERLIATASVILAPL